MLCLLGRHMAYVVSTQWRSVCIDSPVFYEHRRCQGGQVLSSHQLQHQWVRLWVEAAGLWGQQARLGGVAEQLRQELVVCGHGGVDVLVPESCRVAVHFHRATGSTQRSKVTHTGPYEGHFLYIISYISCQTAYPESDKKTDICVSRTEQG